MTRNEKLSKYFQADNIKSQVLDKIQRGFDRQCASWDPSWPNGGPNPEGPLGNVLWKDYRKTLVNLLAQRVADGNSKATKKEGRTRRDANIRVRRELNQLNSNVFDDYFNAVAADGERSAGADLERALSSDQKRRIYQILVGYLKWSYRYLSECPNASDLNGVRTYDFIENVLVDVYNTLNPSQESQ